MNHHRNHHVHHLHQYHTQVPETHAVNIFKTTFRQEMHIFKKKVECLVSGDSAYSSSSKETIIQTSTAASVVTLGAIVTTLGAVGLLSAAATGGIGLAVAIIGIAIAVGYEYYRSKKKKNQLKNALSMLKNEDFAKDAVLIADRLAYIHQHQLKLCTDVDASFLATACFTAITREMKKNKYLRLRDLVQPGYLEGVILRQSKHLPDSSLHLTGGSVKKAHMRAMLTKPALYCAEDHAVYSCPNAKPKKYGVLFFKSKEDLDEYKMEVEKIAKCKKGWHYEKLHPSETANLMKLSFCKAYANDCHLKEKEKSDESTTPSVSIAL